MSRFALSQTMIILSGLPGTGKTTMARRSAELHDPRVATWSQVKMQRQYFQPWLPGQALFIDSLNSVADNFTEIMNFIMATEVDLIGWEGD